MGHVTFDDSDHEMEVDTGQPPRGQMGREEAIRYRSTLKFRVADPQPGSLGVVTRLTTR